MLIPEKYTSNVGSKDLSQEILRMSNNLDFEKCGFSLELYLNLNSMGTKCLRPCPIPVLKSATKNYWYAQEKEIKEKKRVKNHPVVLVFMHCLMSYKL